MRALTKEEFVAKMLKAQAERKKKLDVEYTSYVTDAIKRMKRRRNL